MLLGLRGVGKTVLLNRIAEIAEKDGYATVVLEAPEDRRLAEMLVPPLRSLLFRLSRLENAKDAARRGLGVLRAFASAFKVKVGDIEFGIKAETGTADSGTLESDLPELLLAVAAAAREARNAVALFVDEVQYLSGEDLGALIVSAHKMAQRSLPFIAFGAGLPQLAGLAGEAKSYSEPLFEYPEVGPLAAEAAKDAIREPMRREGVNISEGALDQIVEKTRGYPYFLQEWGYHAWNVATSSPVTPEDAERATADGLTPREKDYVRAMAALGPGPHRSGEIAQRLSMDVTTAGPLRNGVIKKGMVYSPQHGDTAFTVPMFDEFMRRSMPDWAPPGAQPPADVGQKRRRRRR
jgi:hypothetical protein